MKRALLRSTLLLLVVVAAAMAFAAPARAFTYETKNYTDENGLPRYTDPDKKVEQFTNGNVPDKPGSTNFRFEVGPSNGGVFGRGRGFQPAWGPQPFPDGR